ncbi:hypothetical protein PMAYCL1PPCAC_10046, partial [Pristionchus mayeri]
ATIGSLNISFYAEGAIYREFANIIKEFKNVDKLTLKCMANVYYLHDAQFLELAQSCRELCLSHMRINRITVDTLHRVYQNMSDGSIKLRRFETVEGRDMVQQFLGRIGIYSIALYFTSYRNVEAYRKVENGETRYIIFDGNFEINFTRSNNGNDNFLLKLHENNESLEDAKGGFGLIPIRVERLP